MLPIPSDVASWSLYPCDKAPSSVQVAVRARDLLREIIVDTCGSVMDGLIKAENAQDHAMARWERNIEKWILEMGGQTKDYGCHDTEPRTLAWNIICRMLPEA